jgi:hypothetical protein
MDKDILKIRDIAPPIESLPSHTNWAWLVGAILMTCAILLLFYRLRQHKAAPATTPQKKQPPPSPKDIALQELENLQQCGLIEAGCTKRFFTALNMILRRYLNATLPNQTIRPTSGTTTELQDIIANIDNSQLVSLCNRFLQECDVYKFANIKAMPEIAKRALASCRELIIEIDTISIRETGAV